MLIPVSIAVNMFTTLRQFRQQQGVSQAFVASKLGIHRATFMNYELGRRKPPQSFYYHLAHVFRLPVESVLPLSENAKI